MGCGPSSKVAADSAKNTKKTGGPSSTSRVKKFQPFSELLNRKQIKTLYTAGKQLGAGNMATVYEYRRKKDGKAFAVKVVEKRTLGDPSEFTNELEILGHLKGHPNILELEDVFMNAENYYLVTDLVEGGELFEKICTYGQYTEGLAKRLIKPILEALRFIHENDIVHRDIKPENLLLTTEDDDASLKIADFGVAMWTKNLKKNKYLKCGTPEYMAPEMYRSKSSPYGIEVDVWAMGCVMFIMLCGWHPFQDTESFEKQKRKIISGRVFLDDEAISEEAKEFLRAMLEVDPTKRATIPEILKLPWLKELASDKNELTQQQEKLKKYQALQRLRKISVAVRFGVSVNRAMQQTDLNESESKE